jgi:hypothetical protein
VLRFVDSWVNGSSCGPNKAYLISANPRISYSGCPLGSGASRVPEPPQQGSEPQGSEWASEAGPEVSRVVSGLDRFRPHFKGQF